MDCLESIHIPSGSISVVGLPNDGPPDGLVGGLARLPYDGLIGGKLAGL